MKDNGRGRVLSSRRGPHNSHASEVVPWVLGGHGFVPENAVGKAGVLEILPTHIMKGFRAIGGPHAVHLNNHKTEVSERGRAAHAAEAFWRIGALRPGVNLFDYRIFFVGIEL